MSEADTVTKLDHRQVTAWLADLRRVLPIIPSKDGLVLTADERPLFRFIMNSANGGLTPKEAFAFAGVLENLQGIVDAAASQQRDFAMLRRALMKVAPDHPMVGETDYIEGRT